MTETGGVTHRDIVSQILRYQQARPGACKWTPDEIRQQASLWHKRLCGYELATIVSAFTQVIADGEFLNGKRMRDICAVLQERPAPDVEYSMPTQDERDNGRVWTRAARLYMEDRTRYASVDDAMTDARLAIAKEEREAQ